MFLKLLLNIGVHVLFSIRTNQPGHNDRQESDIIHLIPKAWSEHGVEALWTGQKNILLFCPQCLDSMLAPGFWCIIHRKIYKRNTRLLLYYLHYA